jgi:hypothetical protein
LLSFHTVPKLFFWEDFRLEIALKYLIVGAGCPHSSDPPTYRLPFTLVLGALKAA